MFTYSQPLLYGVDQLSYQVDGDPEIEQEFFAASTPEEMINLAVESGTFIGVDDFRALLTSGSTEWWLVRGEDRTNSIVNLQKILSL